MTTEHWLTIALIISTFIAQLVGPSIAVLLQSRMNQPRENPATTQPTNRIQRIGGRLKRWFISPWSPLLWIFVNICFLVILVRDSEPITRGWVLVVALCVANISYNFLFMLILFILRYLARIVHEIGELVAIDRRIISIIESMSDIQGEMVEGTTNSNASSLLDKVVSNIKRLL